MEMDNREKSSDLGLKIFESWADTDGKLNTFEDIKDWIAVRNRTICVEINKIALENDSFWFYDTECGIITNKNHSFFSISGFTNSNNQSIDSEQPILIQDEIGYLGILCKVIDGTLYFLMQAKIEPGNVNKIQLSPTIQATKSNFTQKHGGAKPPYLEYFIQAHKYQIVVDQIQSEQSGRFYKKRNRNIVICVDEDIDVLPSHKWVTLGQIKKLMKIDNLVNMDTRTVLASIPYSKLYLISTHKKQIQDCFKNQQLFQSIICQSHNSLVNIYHSINNYKMFNNLKTNLIPLFSLQNWHMNNGEFICKHNFDFKVIFCDIAIEGREVKRWTQPLFEAIGMATFGLLINNDDGITEFLVRICPEPGCFDQLEIGPSVQISSIQETSTYDAVSVLFFKLLSQHKGIKYKVDLSEEGGRFFQEQNHNVIIEISKNEIQSLPDGYFWVTFGTLNELVQINNCLNIQLRNLLSLFEV